MQNLASVPHLKPEIVLKYSIFLLFSIRCKKNLSIRHYLAALSR